MNPTACHGCADNPQGNEQKKLNTASLERHRADIEHIERLHDAVRMGLLRFGDLSEIEFEMLRPYWWEIEKIRMKSGVRL